MLCFQEQHNASDEKHPSSRYCVNKEKPNSNGKIPRNIQNNFQQRTHLPELDRFEHQLRNVLQKISVTIENHEKRQEDQDRRDLIKTEWQQIAQIVDRVLLSIFVVVTLTVTIVVMVQGPVMYGTPIDNDIHD